MSLFSWEPAGKFTPIDTVLSPIKKEQFSVGAQIEDIIPESRDRVVREIAPPAYTALDYVICDIDDDPQQVNAFGIYHPADLAISLGNLKTQGVKHIFISTHLHWPQYDAEENNTLATALKGFESSIVATPLRRSLTSDPITPAFLRASIPVSAAFGDTEFLPVINSLSVFPDIDFPENTLAGFSALESEKSSDTLPLIARWGDRLVFSAPLLALMQHSKILPEQLIVYPGQYIRMGHSGNIVPIDNFGHFRVSPTFKQKPAPRRISSALSGQSTIIGATQKFAILTANGTKSSAFEAVGAPYEKLSQLSFTPRVSSPETLKRVPFWLECILIVDAALLACWFLCFRSIPRTLVFILTALTIWAAFWATFQLFSYWSPLSLYLIPLTAGWLITLALSKFKVSNHKS